MKLDYEVNNHPSWRQEDPLGQIPCVKDMIRDIAKYIQEWKRYKNETDSKLIRRKLRKIRVKYLVHTQIEENIGVQDYEETDRLIPQFEEGLKIDNEEKMVELKMSENNSNILPKKRKLTTESIVEVKRTKDMDGNKLDVLSELDQNKNKVTVVSQTSQEELIDSLNDSQCTDFKKLETINLYEGLKHIESIITCCKDEPSSQEEIEELDKLLEVRESIIETHRKLTTEVLTIGMIPGVFSIKETYAMHEERYYYPHYEHEAIAESAVQAMIDQYNTHLQNVKKELQSKVTIYNLEKLFKLAASLLFTFLELHPFSDGNGRLGRLLCSHVLGLISPFPTPVYNVFSETKRIDFLNALKKARNEINLKLDLTQMKREPIKTRNDAIKIADGYMNASPSDLVSLIVESNWYVWRELMDIKD